MEAEPRFARLAFSADEFLEQLRGDFGRDAAAAVIHGDEHAFAVAREGDGDLRIARLVAPGVLQEVVKDALEPVPLAHHRQGRAGARREDQAYFLLDHGAVFVAVLCPMVM